MANPFVADGARRAKKAQKPNEFPADVRPQGLLAQIWSAFTQKADELRKLWLVRRGA